MLLKILITIVKDIANSNKKKSKESIESAELRKKK